LPLQCAVVSLHSVVKQRLKCNTGKVRNCLVQFLLTLGLSIKERVFLVKYVFREGNRYTDLVREQFDEKFPETTLPYRNAVRTLIEEFRETGSVLDAGRSGRPSELDDNKLMDISDSVLRSASKS
jgi:transposase